MSRCRGPSKDWDPMRDDFNDSLYGAQYQDDDANDGVQLEHSKLYVSNIAQGLSEEGLRLVFAKFGSIVRMFFSKDPKKRYAIITFESPSEAKLAMMKLNRTEPLKLNVAVAHKRKPQEYSKEDSNVRANQSWNRQYKDEISSVSSKDNSYSRKQESNCDNEIDDTADDDMSITGSLDPELHLELEQLKLKQLELEQARIQCKQRILLLNRVGKKPLQQFSNRFVTLDGKIVVKTSGEKSSEVQMDGTYSGGGDSKDASSRQAKTWAENTDSSTPSTCVLCSEDRSTQDYKDKSECTSKCDVSDKNLVKSVDFTKQSCTKSRSTLDFSKSVASRKSDTSRCIESKQSDVSKREIKNLAKKSEMSCDLKGDYYIESDDEDETNRLIQLRNADYMDIVEEQLKIVIALAGYPKSKMRLKQMEVFQRSINDIMDMQQKAGLLKKSPSFIDYYLNRGAIVCICKDASTRDWMVRISPGLQERMAVNVILLKAKVKRLCVAVMKIPQTSWPATAHDAFKLLQYFNPTLKTYLWQIYGQKIMDDIECTSFLIDRISGEIIRGPTFKNVIDYSIIDFELTGFTEIYYDCFLSDMEEDLRSVSSRVKLLEEIRSSDTTPRIANRTNDKVVGVICESKTKVEVNSSDVNDRVDSAIEMEEEDRSETKEEFRSETKDDDRNETKTVDRFETKEEDRSETKETHYELDDIKVENDLDSNGIITWANENNDNCNRNEMISVSKVSENTNCNEPSNSTVAFSEKTESFIGSSDNLILSRNSNLNIDSNRGIAYHRRTNYLHVENELKLAITLAGYPKDKLEGNHIRRMKHLFKEYLHKDMKMHRFTNMIIPKFLDVYLSNGAVIYICDSLETKDYLTEVLPKLMNSTGLKLAFREVQNLVRYTRIVMRLPKEMAHLESIEILSKLQIRYPSLKPDCWKYYSDIAGKQKRQFGVDPDSLHVIKSSDFDSTYEGENIVFRIIDRQKRDNDETIPTECEPSVEDLEKQKKREQIVKRLYCPIVSDRANSSLTRIRANHYSDLVPDDLKLYVGPENYPETRIDENMFQTIKKCFEDQVFEIHIKELECPKMHDIYLFDGVIFIICKNMSSKLWIQEAAAGVNRKFKFNLKVTEFRGAVGIVNLTLDAGRDPDEVISILQKQNSRLRTKYWRKISTVRTKSKLEIVLQLDKLSAQVISNKSFNGSVGRKQVTFKLGHLKSLINPKLLLETEKPEITIPKEKTPTLSSNNSEIQIYIKPSVEIDNWNTTVRIENKSQGDISESKSNDLKNGILDTFSIIKSDSGKSTASIPKVGKHNNCKLTLKVPPVILPYHEDRLEMILDLLQDKNPGINTELWNMQRSQYSKGVFNFLIDKQSAMVVKSKRFNPLVFGERLKITI